MYAISFRIPFSVLGTTQYVNGSLRSTEKYPVGSRLQVMKGLDSAIAEVIQCDPTKRVDFDWEIFSLSY